MPGWRDAAARYCGAPRRLPLSRFPPRRFHPRCAVRRDSRSRTPANSSISTKVTFRPPYHPPIRNHQSRSCSKLTQPLALASGDFDKDGVPDLISSYAGYAGVPPAAFITLHRGNVDSIYPNTHEAEERKARGEFTDAPFLSPAKVFAAPTEPDFIGAGDFDADGHLDVVMAARGTDRLYWIAGDGHGGFGGTPGIELPGRVTAMTVGEVNRRDGLADVGVGVTDVAQTFRL